MLKGDVSLVDVVVCADAVFFAVVVCADERDVPGVSLKPGSACVTGAAELSRGSMNGERLRIVRFDAEAERGDADYVVDITATVGGAASKLPGPSVPARG